MAITYHLQDCDFRFDRKTAARDWIKRVAAAEGFKTGDIAIVFCSDRAILEINRTYLEHDYFTDIITFDYSEPGKLSGDLMISVDTVRENASGLGIMFEKELARVIIHGILHLAGYGDKTPEQERIIRETEDKYLQDRY